MKINRCPLCQSSYSTHAFSAFDTHGRHLTKNSDIYSVHQCNQCKTIFLKGLTVNQQYYHRHYASNYYSPLPKILLPVSNYSFKQKINTIFHYAPISTASILDIGCSSGDFLSRLSSLYKLKCYGLDINPQVAAQWSHPHIHLYTQDILKAKINRKFDIITLWQTIEHLPQPKETIIKIKQLLKPKGILVISVPNSSSLGYRLGKQFWFHLDAPRHLFIPTKKSMSSFLLKNGFDIISSYSEPYDYPLDLFWSIRRHLLKYLILLFYPLIKLFDREIITIISRKSDEGIIY